MDRVLQENKPVLGFEDLLRTCDPTLYDGVYSQLESGDKRSLLALQNVIRNRGTSYVYLEIGSYMGGSLQTHLLDPRCRKLYSIDIRPSDPPDNRGDVLPYPHNSTSLMLENLKAIAPGSVAKVQCIEASTSQIDASVVTDPPDLCFIDGEHTAKAVADDFRFCRSVLADNGIILFHDSNVVFDGIQTILDDLTKEQVVFSACVLPFSLFVLEFGGDRVRTDSYVHPLLLDNYTAYLGGLMLMKHYRDVFNGRSVRVLRFIHRRLQEIQTPSLALSRLREIFTKS